MAFVVLTWSAGLPFATAQTAEEANNTVLGAHAGESMKGAGSNTLIGTNAGGALVAAMRNVFIGDLAGLRNKADDNVFVGFDDRSTQYNGHT